MVLRAFAAHDAMRETPAARRAADLLAARLYRRDRYPDRAGVEYWERVSFPFWFTDVVSALDTLSRLGLSASQPQIAGAIERLRSLQRPDGTFAFHVVRGADPDAPLWICLAGCRSLRRWSQPPGP
jgi:hypothetical protein